MTDNEMIRDIVMKDNRDEIALAVLKGSARIDLEKDYLVKICECMFDITRVALELIANEVIEPPEDDRELFFFIKDASIEFEDEYVKDDIEDYFERVEAFAEKELKERFPKKRDEESPSVIVSKMRSKEAPAPPIFCCGDYYWQIWEVRSKREFEALREVLFEKEFIEFSPKNYPCVLYTYEDQHGYGGVVGEYSEIVESYEKYMDAIRKSEDKLSKE